MIKNNAPWHMRVIITGGSGLIGRALAENLAHDEYEIIILTRTPEKIQGLPPIVRLAKWDGCTVQGWGSLADGADAIVNLAGANISGGRWTPARKRVLLESRLNAGKAVVEAVNAATHPPRVVVQASAVGYYGARGDEQVNEEAGRGSDFLASLTVAWEKSTFPVEEKDVRRAVVRSGVVLSRTGGAFPRLKTPFKFYAGGRLGSGLQWFPWIHLEDEVSAIRFLIENKSARGVFNLVAPETLRNAEFSRLLGARLRRPSMTPLPASFLRLLFGEMATVLLDGQKVIPQRLVEMGFQFKYPTAQSALEHLT